jgi:hypothetical protein
MDTEFRASASCEGLDKPAAKQMVRDLLKKAEEYLLALEMETDFKSDQGTMARLQMALLEDFIEVHNAALRSNLVLPEEKERLDRLIG